MLIRRVVVAVLLVLVCLAILVLDNQFAPYYPFLALGGGLVVWVTAGEYARLVRDGLGLGLDDAWARGGCLFIYASNWLAAAAGPSIGYAATAMVACYAAVFARCVFRYAGPGESLARLAHYIFLFFFLGLLLSFAAQTRWMSSEPGEAAALLCLCVFTPKAFDIMAFAVGASVGRTKLAPVLSPQKTVEGTVAGLAGAALMPLAWLWATWPEPPLVTGLPPAGAVAVAVAYGLTVGSAAQVGDLMASLVKRDCRQKDSSRAVPGFGGLLDVVDSILFAAPVAYLWFTLA